MLHHHSRNSRKRGIIFISLLFLVFLNIHLVNSTSSISNKQIIDYYWGDATDLTTMKNIPQPIPESCVGKQRSWITASILSLVMGGFGIDRLYLGLVFTGLMKMFIGITVGLVSIFRCCLSFSVDPYKFTGRRKMVWIFMNSSVLFLSCIQFTLWLFDLVMIMTGSVVDVNRCPLHYNS